jgi:tRNA (guanine-N1)-methyltransferase
LVLSDALIRLIPGVLSDETSALTDSFQDGLLSGPIYTRLLNTKDGKFRCIKRQLAKIDGVKIWLMNTQNAKTRFTRRVK